MAIDIINPRIYTKDSFYYHFIWDLENNENIDLTQKYEVLVYIRGNLGFTKCNLNNLLIVTYNEPISALDIENLCSKESDFSIPDNCINCKFKIRKKEENPVDWDSEELPMFPDNDYSLLPVPTKCNVVSENNNTRFVFSVSQDLKNYINQTNNYLSKYIITPFKRDLSGLEFPSLNCYRQSSIYSTQFLFDLYYNSNLKLNTEYITPIFYERINSNKHDIIDWDKIFPTTNQEVVDTFEINLPQDSTGMTHYLPNDDGALVYIENGTGWKINQQVVEPNSNYKFSGESLIFDGAEAQTDLIGYFFTAPFEQTYDLGRDISITTGLKYAQQIKAFDDLNTIRPISDISNDEFTYQYDSINKNTPVFIYQKMIDNTYNLTNNSSNLYKGVLNTDFINTSQNDLIVTTSPVVEVNSSNNYVLKTSNITTEEINEYTEEHKDMLNVNKIFNSLEEEFIWQTFNITQEKGQPKLTINAQKNDFSDLYSYKILIQNQMSNRDVVNEELDLKYFATGLCWCIYKNNVVYYDGYVLSDLMHNELSSKEKYHIIIKRIYNGDEYIIDERDVTYEDNTDFFLAPSNNINYNPGEKNNFYFSTERNNSENAAQGYPWLIYNNEDNASYFCYSNQAYNNNADNRGIDNYDSNKSDNKQLIHINYHDKPNFTPKEVIPMLDFKITELIENSSYVHVTNEVNMIVNENPLDFSATTNGSYGSFELNMSNYTNEGYISFSNLVYLSKNSQPYYIEILDTITNRSLFSASNLLGSADITNAINGKKISKNANLKFNLTNCTLISSNMCAHTLNESNNTSLLQKRKFYIDNFSINEIDYSQIENGSIISGQVLELHKPVTLHIEDFTTNMLSNNSIYYKIEKINEYNQDVLTPIDDDNSITILQKDKNGNEFTKDFYINSHTNQLKIQNTKTKQITFNNAQKDTIVNCILEKEEVED